MVLPKCLGDHPEKGAGLELIERLYIDKNLKQPNYIIAVTSHEDAYNENISRLLELGVPIILADNSFDVIKKALTNKINYCLNNNNSISPKKEIIAILDAPPKVTIKWLYQHVSATLWLGTVMFLLAVFTLGVKTSKLTIIKQIYSIEDSAVKASNKESNELINLKTKD
jgi:hypothetical protein